MTIIIVGIIIFVICLLISSASNRPPITLDELDAFYRKGGTALQKAEQWKTYSGRNVVGEGTVKSVLPLSVESESISTQHYIVVDVESILTTGPVEVTLWFSESEKKKLLLIEKGQKIKYSATISLLDYKPYDFDFHFGCKLL